MFEPIVTIFDYYVFCVFMIVYVLRVTCLRTIHLRWIRRLNLAAFNLDTIYVAQSGLLGMRLSYHTVEQIHPNRFQH